MNYFMPRDVWQAVEKAFQNETSESGHRILGEILENARIAGQKEIALCQDTGLVEIFLKIGQDAKITGGDLYGAIYSGVARGYRKGFLRASIVTDPLDRKNTGDNTPPIIYPEVVPGENLSITILAKGGGSENASVLKMLMPQSGWSAVKDFIISAVREKGINACPPLIAGIGIGGSFSSVAHLAKKALLRELGVSNSDFLYAQREKEILEEVNKTGIGPMGLGGNTTALAAHIESAPCHIACLPVAVSMQCHSLRRITETI